MEKRMNKDELVNLIESLKISKDEYWILSSSALVLRGIYKDAGDLDIAVTEKGLQELKENYTLKEKDNGWYTVNEKVECVLDTKESWKIEKFEGYNLESIEKYYTFLKSSDREKDKARLGLVEKYMASRANTCN
ncbi:acetyltransferase GNAT family [Clostridium sp. CAG:921]|nr:acetyltransferase GNAT family [Clostridium sp. CAG:921]